MAKYDTYTAKYDFVAKDYNASIILSVLFEDGDNVETVISEASNKLRVEALKIKAIE